MENKDKIQDEFIDFWEKTDNVGLGNYSDAVTQWWFEKIESILESKQEEIEKTIKNEDKFVSQGCKVCGCGMRSEAKGGQGGNGACGCSCHSTWNL